MSESPFDADANFVMNMKAARDARGWTQAQLAEELAGQGVDGMNQSAVSRIEKGEREVRLAEARAIATAFGTTVDALSDPPERFQYVLEWNALSGSFNSAKDQLEMACRAYEQARSNLAEYLKAPKVGLTKRMSGRYEFQSSRDAQNVALGVIRELNPSAYPEEPPF